SRPQRLLLQLAVLATLLMVLAPLVSRALQAQPMDISAFPKALVAFDKSPLRRDGDVLMAWWKQRLAEAPQQVALFYNTISLYDGNRIVGADGRS
ncbi:cellulose biosynthesis protein BcsG, partial [Listeria seeligeri]|uniref:cellulose biosynthesis protein BcsG n=1 Tax=Listeria seeligeri TaxID=1640 RepID=UPI0022EB6A9A